MNQKHLYLFLPNLFLPILVGVLFAESLAAQEAPFDDVRELVASDGVNNDLFGESVAIDGGWVVVGAPQHDGPTNSGAVYIYAQHQGGAHNWGFFKKLTASDAANSDLFGEAVAIEGDRIVVGASAKRAIYIFERDAGGPDQWGEVTQFTTTDGQFNDLFGDTVSLSGDTILVGAFGDDGECPSNGACNSGAAYIFQEDFGGVGNWGQVVRLTASDAALGDSFGKSVDIHGDVAVVGAPREDGDGLDIGAAYIFERDHEGSDNWGEVRKITGSDVGNSGFFGESVAVSGATVSGDTVIVGAPNQNAAYVFERNHDGPNQWGEFRTINANDDNSFVEFGRAAALQNDLLVVGARRPNGTGVAYVFDRDEGVVNSWGQLGKLLSTGNTDLGAAVALSGNTMVGGAPLNNNSGSAFVFQSPLIFADGFESGDTSAWAVE